MSASTVTGLNSYQMDVRGTYCSCTNQDWQTRQRPSTPSADQQSTQTPVRRELTDGRRGGRCLQSHPVFTGGWWSPLREASRFSLLVPSHLTTCHWPLHAPPHFLCLSGMHRLNPFYPEAPLGITCSLRNWNKLKSEGGSTFCASEPQILYLETFFFWVFRLFSDCCPRPTSHSLFWFVYLFFCGVS